MVVDKDPDYGALCPYFGWLSLDTVKETFARTTQYAHMPMTIDGGAETYAQLFVGTESLVTDVEGMKMDKQFVNTPENNIHHCGAPTMLISNCAQVEISYMVKGILHALCILDWQSDPHQQQQNPAERQYQTVKAITNTILDHTGSPAYLWFLCLMYVCFLLNNTSLNALSGAVPIQVLTGSTNDISPLLQFLMV
jgi:hypothetical protein